MQIEKEVFKFNKLLGLRSTTFAGGLSKYQQFRTIKGEASPKGFYHFSRLFDGFELVFSWFSGDLASLTCARMMKKGRFGCQVVVRL